MKSSRQVWRIIFGAVATTLFVTSAVLSQDDTVSQELAAHINWASNDSGSPSGDCNAGHPLCCSPLVLVNGVLARSQLVSTAVTLAKQGPAFCPEAIASLLLTQCHNPEAMNLIVSNSDNACRILTYH
jgi:hypothetical protein